MDNERLTAAVMAMQADIAQLNTNMKAAFKRIDEQKELTESVHKIALSVESIANEQKHMKDDIACVRRDVDEVKSKPAKRWESMIGAVIVALVGGAIGYFIK